MFDRGKEESDLRALRSREGCKVSIDVMGKLRIDPGNSKSGASRKKHLCNGLHEGRFTSVKNREPRRRTNIT
jgi:hypothetical protein